MASDRQHLRLIVPYRAFGRRRGRQVRGGGAKCIPCGADVCPTQLQRRHEPRQRISHVHNHHRQRRRGVCHVRRYCRRNPSSLTLCRRSSNQLTASSTANLQFSMLSFTGLGFVGLSAILETDSDATKVGYSYDGTPPLHSGGDDPLPPSTAYRFAPIGSLCAAAFTLGVLLTHV